MNLRQAAQQALEALEKVTRELLAVRDELAERGGRPTTNVFHQRLWDSSFDAYTNHAMPVAEALRTALAEPEQKPVAWANMRLDGRTPTMLSISQHPEDRANWVNPVPLYTHPAPQPVTLTDEEIDRVTDQQWAQHDHKPIYAAHRAYARAIERAHGIGEQS